MYEFFSFSINENLEGAYEVVVHEDDNVVRVHVPGENDLTFAINLYNDAPELLAAARNREGAKFGRKIQTFFIEAGVPTSLVMH